MAECGRCGKNQEPVPVFGLVPSLPDRWVAVLITSYPTLTLTLCDDCSPLLMAFLRNKAVDLDSDLTPLNV